MVRRSDHNRKFADEACSRVAIGGIPGRGMSEGEREEGEKSWDERRGRKGRGGGTNFRMIHGASNTKGGRSKPVLTRQAPRNLASNQGLSGVI